MLLIKLSAQDIRIIERATTEQELQGVRQMIKDRIVTSQALKLFNRAPTEEKRTSLGWAKAWEITNAVLGKGNVTMPPYPDNSWYARVGGVIRREGMTEESVQDLAGYCGEYLRKPVSFDFMICQHHRIKAGEFNVKPPAKPIELPKLPEPEEGKD